ncbi:MAG: cobalamin-independent methionine synthase II family protein [Chthoniobacterales bacterium]
MKSSKLPPLFTHPIGSLPRPQAVLDLLAEWQEKKISKKEFNKRMDDFILFAIGLQEQAGMDVVSDGEWRRSHYLNEYLMRIGGFAKIRQVEHQGASHVTWVCNGKIRTKKPVFTADAKFLVKHAHKATKFALPSPFLVATRLWDKNYSTKYYPTKNDLVFELAETLATEAKALDEAGIDIIQIDDPALTYYCDPDFVKGTAHDSRINLEESIETQIPITVDAINKITEGLKAETHIHCCHSVSKRRSDVKGSYKPLLPLLSNLKVDRINLEFAYRDTGEISDLTEIPANMGAGAGVVDVRQSAIQTTEEILEIAKKCLSQIDASRLSFSPDCGFAPDAGEPPTVDEAYNKLKNMCDAVKQLRA